MVSKAVTLSGCIYLSRRMVFRYILHVNRKKKLENDGFEVHLIKNRLLLYIEEAEVDDLKIYVLQ